MVIDSSAKNSSVSDTRVASSVSVACSVPKASKPPKTCIKIILDTSVLLYDAMAIYAFECADIYIPFAVLEEIDTFKRDMGEKGRHARQFNRYLDDLRQRGSLTKGVLLKNLENRSRLFVAMDAPEHPPELSKSQVDHRILSTALFLQKQQSLKKQKSSLVKLVTKDINLRIKADVFGIQARDYDPQPSANVEDLYTGIQQQSITAQQKEMFKKNHFLSLDGVQMYSNQYLVMKHGGEQLLGRYDYKKQGVVSIYQPSEPIWGVYPRNVEQSFAMDALMNNQIMCVSLLGKAGTGKTLFALAVGLYKTLDENVFQKLLVSRPVFPMGRDIGYLPGDITQKLNPWMQPIFDSVELLMGLGKKASRLTQDLVSQGLVNIEPLAYIRGRSIPNQYLIVDEAQNLTPHEIKTVLTRAGHGTKVILTGDCYQIDNPYVDSSNNGLVFSVEKFKTESLFAHVTLNKGERSALAELSANIL